MSLFGTWHIYEMETWDEDYFNEEVQAYINIKRDQCGEFQFGYVTGYFEGELESKKRLVFSFEGEDENDPCSGRGYIELVDENKAKGKFYIHQGDSSEFSAKRYK